MTTSKWAKLVPELLCTDFSASVRFYVSVLGFRVAYDRPEDNFAYLDFHGAQLMIEQTDEPWLTGPMEKPYGRGINIQIEVPAIEPLLKALKRVDWPIYREFWDAWYRCNNQMLGNRQFLVQDPDGYLLRFYENLGTKPV
ncbi:MAG: VOC family protein [Rhizobiales bacterium]|nr:VOC family protein [Hyphomicrobiales bacterium]